MMKITEKRCTRCHMLQDVSCFSICAKSYGGTRSECKKCIHDRVKVWKEANPDRFAKHLKTYAEKKKAVKDTGLPTPTWKRESRMSFVKYTRNNRKGSSRADDFVLVGQTGGSSSSKMLCFTSSDAAMLFGLGNRVELLYDSENHLIGLRRCDNNADSSLKVQPTGDICVEGFLKQFNISLEVGTSAEFYMDGGIVCIKVSDFAPADGAE